MKLFIILLLVSIFFALLYFRLRPYLRLARRMFAVVRDVRAVSQNEPAQPLQSQPGAGTRLVRCDACGTWIPASRAVKLRSSASAYCSHACLEASAAESGKRKTAG